MRLRLTVLVLLPLLSTTYGTSRGQQSGAVPVGTVAAALRPITQSTDFVGRVEAKERVDIRARVTGFLQAVLFNEGDHVEEGQILYEIEPDSFKAAEMHARGALLQAQARFANATVQRVRSEELVKSKAAAQSELDRRVAEEKSAQGDIVSADANLKSAQINLGYTQIVAPISGEIGRSKYTKGNLVGPDSGPLTVIVSRDPMYVTFPVSQREFLKIEREGGQRSQQRGLAVKIRFSDGSVYDQTGTIDFVDVTVNRATDTVLVRATIPNPSGQLIDGELVRVSVSAGKPEEKVLVPQAALVVDQQGTYVFVVEDGKAVVKRLKLGGEQGPYAVVNQGLKGGEQVVVQGMETLRPGSEAIASPAPPPPLSGS
ncbi:MAG: efflux RND transporter periplasmic adaptor subunit [Acetobacteraceae bacterium]|nr:efflux RND transporter periplasmic adaptor subunit [Acetobacteraceae bacterium]